MAILQVLAAVGCGLIAALLTFYSSQAVGLSQAVQHSGAAPSGAKPLGNAPAEGLGALDLYTHYRLPAEKHAVKVAASKLQVARRARALRLTRNSAVAAWSQAETTLQAARSTVQPSEDEAAVVFTASTASQLNEILRSPNTQSVRVASSALQMDESLLIQRGTVTLDLGQTHLQATPASPAYLLRVENARGVTIRGGVFSGAASGILVSHSQQVQVQQAQFERLLGNGIVITQSQNVVFWGNRLTGLQGTPVLVHGATTGSVIAENSISRNKGSANFQAGILLADRKADLAATPLSLVLPDPEGRLMQPIPDRTQIPRNNVVAFNRIAHNRSSGIYSDGGVENVIVSNTLEGNSKEGLCLDNGSSANVVAFNLVQRNGKRWGKTDEDLKREHVFQHGRLPDGTSPVKVPGISIDNAMHNIVYANQVHRNYGGGIKLVRTAYLNAIGVNTLISNNEGQNPTFHFFGIEVGSATADEPVHDLDFTPSRGNLLFSNILQGSHYAGIFFGDGSDQNQALQNGIFGAKAWALESVKRQANISVQNLTDSPSRNMKADLEPSAGR